MIDAYTHCGISKFEPVELVLATMAAAGVERAVLVQHLGEYDNSYLAEVVGERPEAFAVVALADPEASDWEERLAEVAESGHVRGLRLTTEMLLANGDLALGAAAAGLVPVLYTPDGVAPARQRIVELAAAAPDRPIVITHLGCPKVEGKQMVAGWELLEFSDLTNVMVTLSGLGMLCPYPHRPLSDFVGKVVEEFTAHRIMWGSNYPVLGDASDYARDLDLVLAGWWGFSPEQVERISETNAAETFFAAPASDRED